jgi:GntR family transcriptional regulator
MIPNDKHIFIPPISPAAPGPLYRQIVDGVKREISEGRLRPAQPLPSFRILAEDLMVSLITVKRAYEDLEREGIIYRRQGLGTFVSEDGDVRNRAAKRLRAENLLEQAVRTAAEAGMKEREIIDLTRELIRQRKGEVKDGKSGD